MRFRTSFRLALFLLTTGLLPAATALLRGPYLQLATPTSLVVRWRTDATEGSHVRYGLAKDALTSSANAFGFASEHIVQLSGLQPATRYY